MAGGERSARKSSSSTSVSKTTKTTLSNLKGDYGNIAFLLLLYVLQGIPIGLSSAVPLLLQNRKVSYSDQALFSFVTWPFSLKLLWAPIVDSLFWRKIGRRKSWLVPVQMAIGLFMLILSKSITELLADDASSGRKPNIQFLTFIFLMLNFLAATQDIAVDGWALTMLSRRNVGYASTCNTAGQTAGFFIGNVVFMALESTDFCNKYLRSAAYQATTGIVTFESFLHNCGIVFVVVTLLVALLKSEKKTELKQYELLVNEGDDSPLKLNKRKNSDSNIVKPPSKSNKRNKDYEGHTNDESGNDSDDSSYENNIEKELSVRETYSLLYKIIKLPSLQLFAVILLTCKIGFAAPDAVSGLKLVEAGVHKENLALLAVPMVPLQIILPWAISRITCGPRPLDLYLKSYPYRLLFGIIFPLIVYWTPNMKLEDGTFPAYYYLILIITYGLHQITVYSMFVASMAFTAAISDPSIGGTYMTLLNTISNLGGNWPSTSSLWLVDKLTIQNCTQVCKNITKNIIETQTTVSPLTLSSTSAPSSLGSNDTKLVCSDDCKTTFDGYYSECAICVVIGFLWLHWGSQKLKRLQSLPLVAWKVNTNLSNKVH